MHELRKTSLYSFAVLPAFGLALSAITHVAALSGKDGPLGNYTLRRRQGAAPGHWMILYATAAALLYSATFCGKCEQPLDAPTNAG